MSSMDSKRVQYRKYLEHVGVIDAMSKALIKLYEDNDKPEDAIRFVRKFLCETCPSDDHFDMMRAELEEANRKIAKLEQDLERLRLQIKLTPEEIEEILEENFKDLTEDEVNDQSLLRKYLTREVLDELMPLTTPPPYESTLLDCVKSGMEHHSSRCGVYAADPDSYDVFGKLFDPIIRDYHDELETDSEILQPNTDYGDMDEIENLDKDRRYIQSTRIRIARNLSGYPFFSKLSEKELTEIEEKVRWAAENLIEEHTGAYYTLEDLSMQIQEKMVERHILYQRGDAYLQAAGCYRFWPTGRGIFHNPAETFLIWVNSESHLQIISLAKYGDLGDVYHRLITGVQELETHLKFIRHPKYGFLTACPTCLGTTLCATVRISLPLLSKDDDRLRQMVEELKLQIRGTRGEYNPFVDDVMDISNKYCLGATEFELIKDFQDGVKELIKAEEELEASGGDREC